MSNYPNMSYCMFQNTRLAMEQLIEAMNEAVKQGPEGIKEFYMDMDQQEKRALTELFCAYEDFVDLAHALEDAAFEQEASDDSCNYTYTRV